jgi:beta-lactamase superfamily II metal-dependent hydrolase
MYRITLFPAEDGDCILVETGSAASPHRLLIDGGRKPTYSNHFAKIFAQRTDDRPAIDLLVLTHVDADHIEGLLEFIAASSSDCVGEVWFNGSRQTGTAKFGPAKERKASPDKTLSPAQGLTFEGRLLTGKWKWNTSFNQGPVMTEEEGELPSMKLSSDAVLTLLGPPKAKLVAFHKSWGKPLAELLEEDAQKTMAGRPFPELTPDGLAALAAKRNVADNARANGTSIAFAISAEEKCCLFCADAHPGDIANALERFSPGKERVCFDAIKASHHGSAANNTNALIGRLHSPKWLISTNGAVHHHPDPEAISRIVLAEPKGKQIIFNHKGPQTQPWEAPILQNAHGFSTCFPGANGQPMVIDLA